MLEARVVLRLELLELGRVARREREQLQHVQAEEPLGVEQAELAGDHRAVVAAVDAVGLVAEPAHEGVVRGGDPADRPAGVGDRLAEAEAGRVGHDDVEGVLGAAAVRDRVDERSDHVEVVDEGSRVGVGEDQRRRARVRGADVHEVDRLTVDLGGEVRELVHARLGRAPVEPVAPARDGVARGTSSACPTPSRRTAPAGAGGCARGGRRGHRASACGTSMRKGRMSVVEVVAVFMSSTLRSKQARYLPVIRMRSNRVRDGRHIRPDARASRRCCRAARDWPGPELAARLDVSVRTIRNDIERLRALGYPVEAERGRAGSYRLARGRQAAAAPARRRRGGRRGDRPARGDAAWRASRRPAPARSRSCCRCCPSGCGRPSMRSPRRWTAAPRTSGRTRRIRRSTRMC